MSWHDLDLLDVDVPGSKLDEALRTSGHYRVAAMLRQMADALEQEAECQTRSL